MAAHPRVQWLESWVHEFGGNEDKLLTVEVNTINLGAACDREG